MSLNCRLSTLIQKVSQKFYIKHLVSTAILYMVLTNIKIIFYTWMKILCSHWLPEVWNPRTSSNAEFPPLRCFFRPLPTAAFSCCLFVGLSALGIVFSNWKACSVGFRSGDWPGYWGIIHFFALCCFHSMFWVIIHLYCETPSYQFCSI